jgi:hypothetical protein
MAVEVRKAEQDRGDHHRGSEDTRGLCAVYLGGIEGRTRAEERRNRSLPNEGVLGEGEKAVHEEASGADDEKRKEDDEGME